MIMKKTKSANRRKSGTKGVKPMLLMLEVFRACIETQTKVLKDSPCHSILKKIIKDNRVKL